MDTHKKLTIIILTINQRKTKMGKAARLNRERREKAMRDDPDWNDIIVGIWVKQRTWMQGINAFIAAGVSIDLALSKGIEGLFFSLALNAIADHLKENAIDTCNAIATQVYVLDNNSPHFESDSVEGFVITQFRGDMIKSSFGSDGNEWISRDPSSENDYTVIHEVIEDLVLQIPECRPVFFFPDESPEHFPDGREMKSKWTLEDVLMEGKLSYGNGVFVYGDKSGMMAFIPIDKDDVIGLSGLLHDLESNYYMLCNEGLSIFPIDPSKRTKDKEKDLRASVTTPYRTTRSYLFNLCARVPNDEKLEEDKETVLKLLRDSIWHYKVK